MAIAIERDRVAVRRRSRYRAQRTSVSWWR
jgi:hypothetical protein